MGRRNPVPVGNIEIFWAVSKARNMRDRVCGTAGCNAKSYYACLFQISSLFLAKKKCYQERKTAHSANLNVCKKLASRNLRKMEFNEKLKLTKSFQIKSKLKSRYIQFELNVTITHIDKTYW